MDISALRQEYALHEFDENIAHIDPFQQFKTWFEEALLSQLPEPNAFTLSTLDENEFPTGRVVLLKELTEEGFVFYTNYQSDKAKEIEKNPNVSATFLWLELQRQVRIQGVTKKTDRKSAEEYFKSRPRESQLGAWASPQSNILESRAALDELMQTCRAKFEGQETLPLPDHWGGFVIEPTTIEFWQGRRSRLHDRIKYHKLNASEWKISRLAP